MPVRSRNAATPWSQWPRRVRNSSCQREPDRRFLGGVGDDPVRRHAGKDSGRPRPDLGSASVAEYAYFVNGFNVTNSFRNLNFSKIPFEAIAEQQVKTGGYGAEFRRSLGGVVSQTTKRGTNEFESGSSLYFIPGGLRASTRNANHSNPLEPSSLGTARSINSEEDTSEWTANVWAGGPHGNVCQYVQHDRDDGQPRTSLAPRALQAPRFFQFSVQYQF